MQINKKRARRKNCEQFVFPAFCAPCCTLKSRKGKSESVSKYGNIVHQSQMRAARSAWVTRKLKRSRNRKQKSAKGNTRKPCATGEIFHAQSPQSLLIHFHASERRNTQNQHSTFGRQFVSFCCERAPSQKKWNKVDVLFSDQNGN